MMKQSGEGGWGRGGDKRNGDLKSEHKKPKVPPPKKKGSIFLSPRDFYCENRHFTRTLCKHDSLQT